MEITKELIEELSKRAIKDKKIEIVKINISGPSTNKLVSLEIWHPNVVDLSMCEKVSSEINEILDKEDPFENSYTLEIASLPLTRKLETHDDFRRAMNETLAIKLKNKEAKEIKGKMIDISPDSIVIEVGSEKNSIPLVSIKSGKIIF